MQQLTNGPTGCLLFAGAAQAPAAAAKAKGATATQPASRQATSGSGASSDEVDAAVKALAQTLATDPGMLRRWEEFQNQRRSKANA